MLTESCRVFNKLSQSLSRRVTARSLQTSAVNMEKKPHLEHTANHFRIPDLIDCKITKVEDISPTIKAISLAANNEKKHTFKSGQWVDFFIPGEAQVGGFSMWNSPEHFSETSIIELAIKASRWPPAYWVHNKCKVGDSVQVKFGGEFYYPPNNLTEGCSHNVLLIGGGVGINPLLSIWLHASHLHKTGDSTKPESVHLLYSAINEQELVFRNIIEKTSSENTAFQSSLFVTRSPSASNLTAGRINFEHVKSAVEKLRSTGKDRTLVYLCGPSEMIRDMLKYLHELKIPKQDMFYELWY